MMTTKEKIIRAIIMAQIASDAGKGIHALHINRCGKPGKTGYKSKEEYQIQAIKLIDSDPDCGISYYVSRHKDQNGYPSIVVYFDIVLEEDDRYQIAFHNPPRQAIHLRSYVGHGKKINRIHRFGGADTCARLIDEMNL